MRRAIGYRLSVFAAVLLWMGSGNDVQAQSFQGGVRGAVRDAQGVIPGASVTLTNEATKVARDTTTNDVGAYTFPNVVPGTYTLTVSVTGYKTFERAGLTVATQQFVTMDTVLEVGAIEESITVTGASPLIDTSTASQGTVLDRAQLESLPTPGRNASLMAVTMPTVVSSGNTGFNRQNAQSGATTVSIGGGGVRANNYLLDGVPITDLDESGRRLRLHRGARRDEGAGPHLRRGDGPVGRRRLQLDGEVRHQRVPRLGVLPHAAHGPAPAELLPAAGSRRPRPVFANPRIRVRRTDQEGPDVLLDVARRRPRSARSQLLGELSDDARARRRLLADLRPHAAG